MCPIVSYFRCIVSSMLVPSRKNREPQRNLTWFDATSRAGKNDEINCLFTGRSTERTVEKPRSFPSVTRARNLRDSRAREFPRGKPAGRSVGTSPRRLRGSFDPCKFKYFFRLTRPKESDGNMEPDRGMGKERFDQLSRH